MRNVASVRTLFKFSQLVARNIVLFVLYTQSGMYLEGRGHRLEVKLFPPSLEFPREYTAENVCLISPALLKSYQLSIMYYSLHSRYDSTTILLFPGAIFN